MNIFYPAPIIVFTMLALFTLVISKRARGVKCVLVASYCGIMVTSFTGGNSGAIWLGALFLFLVGPVSILRPTSHALNSAGVSKFTYALLSVFLVAIIVGFLRYDPAIEAQKAGSFATILGLPIRYLIAVYRVQCVAVLFLAFALPLRYYIDRDTFLQCMILCWIFMIVHALAGIIDYFDIYNMAFDPRREVGTLHASVLGFHRTTNGLILVTGIFMSFAMTQLTRSYNLKMLGYISMPIMIIALLFSWSRSSMMALVVAGLSLTITLGGARAIKGVLLAVCGMLVIYIVISRIPELQERFGFLFRYGLPEARVGQARLIGWSTLASWLFKSPGILVFGVGFQNFDYFVNLHAQVGLLMAAHNNFLHILTECGIGGLLVFLGWLASILLWLLSWRRTMTDKIDRMVPGIFISLMLGLVASCMFGESLAPVYSTNSYLIHFYLLLGIWVSYYRTQMSELYAMWETEYEDYVPIDSVAEAY